MKFTASSSELLDALMSVSKVISSKPGLSILENFLFELQGNILTVTASDGETTLRIHVEIPQVEEEGRTALPAKLLTDSLKEFPDQPLTFRIAPGEQVMDIIWASGASKIPCYDAADFPKLPAIGAEAETFNLPAATLLEGINNTLYATADAELRPVLNGIYFDLDEENVTLVASDAQKLVCSEISGTKAARTSAFILNKKPATVLRGILGRFDGEVAIQFDSKNAYFTFGEHILVCRLIEGTYPAYRSVIPKNNTNRIIIGRTDLLNVVKRIAVCSNQISNLIKLSLTHNQVMVSAQDLSFSTSAYEALPCEYEGDAMDIGFKAAPLLEILNNLPYRDICVGISSPTRPVLFVSADDETPETVIKAILSPLMINS